MKMSACLYVASSLRAAATTYKKVNSYLMKTNLMKIMFTACCLNKP